MTRYDWRLRGLAHALLLDQARVDAILRVAYVKAWREVVRIDPREDAAPWLYRVVYNACIDGLRRESSRIGTAPPSAADVADGADLAEESPVQPMAAGGNGASSVTTDGQQARVVEALVALAPADRVAVVLVDREGFAPEAAARILGLPPDVLEARLAGARAGLRHRLVDNIAVGPADATGSQTEEAGSPSDAAGSQSAEVGSPSAEVESSPSDAPAPPSAEVESPSDAPESPSEEAESPSEEVESGTEEAESSPSDEPELELDDTTSADPADTKVASPSIAGGSPNGAGGGGSTNGSDDGGSSQP